MDNILTEMRGVEADLVSREEAWATQFTKGIDKQVSMGNRYLISISTFYNLHFLFIKRNGNFEVFEEIRKIV